MNENVTPRQFRDEVRDALTHLFDIPSLQHHPLLTTLVPPDISDPRERAQCLRETVLQAIADLRPPSAISPQDPEYRPYGILRYKYAEGFSNEDVSARLFISSRQFYREQQRACEAIAELLWSRRPHDSEAPEASGALGEELDHLGRQSREFPLEDLLQQTLAAVRGLADARGVAFGLAVQGLPLVYSDETVCRQLLVSLLSALLRTYSSCFIRVELVDKGGWATALFSSPGSSVDEAILEEHLRTPRGLAAHAGGRVRQLASDACMTVRLDLPSARGEVVAIVDDNQKTAQLFVRYLESGRYRPVAIYESTQALNRIRDVRPGAIVLDIMMRDIDGWQLLQTLKLDPATCDIPVIVCSVLDEADLARTIGADGFLRKPVTQSQLLLALAQARRA
ncbi:MAG: response regulator [Anaerolineae bacterium]